MPPSIEVIIYDLGNVILPFNHYQIAEKLSRCAQRKGFQDPQELFFYLFYNFLLWFFYQLNTSLFYMN